MSDKWGYPLYSIGCLSMWYSYRNYELFDLCPVSGELLGQVTHNNQYLKAYFVMPLDNLSAFLLILVFSLLLNVHARSPLQDNASMADLHRPVLVMLLCCEYLYQDYFNVIINSLENPLILDKPNHIHWCDIEAF